MPQYNVSSRQISDQNRVAARQDDTRTCQGRDRFGRESVVRRIVNTGNVGLGRSDPTPVLTAMETAEDLLAAVKKNGKKGSWSRVRGGRRRIWSWVSTTTASYRSSVTITTTYNEGMCHLFSTCTKKKEGLRCQALPIKRLCSLAVTLLDTVRSDNSESSI